MMTDYQGASHQPIQGRNGRFTEFNDDPSSQASSLSRSLGNSNSNRGFDIWNSSRPTNGTSANNGERRDETYLHASTAQPTSVPYEARAGSSALGGEYDWPKAGSGWVAAASPAGAHSIPDRSPARFRDGTAHSDAHNSRDASPYFLPRQDQVGPGATLNQSPSNALLESSGAFGENGLDFLDASRGRQMYDPALASQRYSLSNEGLNGKTTTIGSLMNAMDGENRSRMVSNSRTNDALGSNVDIRSGSLPPQLRGSSSSPYQNADSNTYAQYPLPPNLGGYSSTGQARYDEPGYDDASITSAMRGMGLNEEPEQVRRHSAFAPFPSSHIPQNPYPRAGDTFSFPRKDSNQQSGLSQNMWGRPDQHLENDPYYRGRPYDALAMPEPGQGDSRRGVPQYFTNGNGPHLQSGRYIAQPHYASNITLRDMQQMYPGYQAPLQQPYEYNTGPGASRAQPYIGSASDRIPASQPGSTKRNTQDDYGGVRSAVLEEFRTNSKSRRYELKDIYNYVVEFSGDQHGSRFIQQKLETANSDEKDIIFAEIRPNSIQLMTDVFGNYVIQKFFEHGNQMHKTILAKQMEGHVLTLSLQMYGCRVVQKAIEHVLADQQASLVKELDGNVLKCVKDQNGNHVVQKAIERVPAEHIQFIISAFKGQVHNLATHPYGCRVIQRMLEYCDPIAQASILQELNTCTYALVQDQYGNYVTQHVIEHGKPEDRAKIIQLVVEHILHFSKHKFASNVVEKSIENSSEEQRRDILSAILKPRSDGQSPLQLLMRDQFGNYVIQKLLNTLHGADKTRLIDDIKPNLQNLKRYTYGKQINAIEKMIADSISRTNTPPTTGTGTPSPVLTTGIMSPSESASDAPSLDNGNKNVAENGADSSATPVKV